MYCPGAQGFDTKQNKKYTTPIKQDKTNKTTKYQRAHNKTKHIKKQTNKKTQTKPVISPLWANIII